MPFVPSEELLTRKVEELGEFDEWKDVSGDLFTVFCVAVRLHSKRQR